MEARSHAASALLLCGSQLKGRPCTTYPSDMRVKITPTGFYAYPDVSLEDVLHLPAIDCHLALAEVYDKVDIVTA